MSPNRRRTVRFILALIVIGVCVAVALLSHRLLRLLTIDIAVARSSIEDRQAAAALVQFLAAEHPQIRVRTILRADRLDTAAALDRGESELALIRSDASPQDGQTLVVLRRDAVVFVVPGGHSIDAVSKLRGRTVGLLDGRRLDARLLDTILNHYGLPPDSIRREMVTVEKLEEAARHRRLAALFLVAPPASPLWLSVYTALRKGSGVPKTLEIEDAAAIARSHPDLDTIDVSKGTFVGSIPAPDDDITTLSVSHRLVARSALPDWLAGEITREVLTGKPKLAALNRDLAGIEAPDTDDKAVATPVHPGAAAYLSGNLPSLSDQAQNALYWLGLVASGVGSLSAFAIALFRHFRPRPPPTRVMRLLEIWLAIRTAGPAEVDSLEAEAETIAADAIRDETDEPSETVGFRLVTLLVAHVREAASRRRTAVDRAGATPVRSQP